jgi:hypothetical protein
MAHDASKVLLGTNQSTRICTVNYAADPATFPAGTAVRMKSDGTISVTKAHGQLIGVSVGKSMSDTLRLAVAREGLLIPILLTDDSDDYSYVVKGAPVYIDDVTGLASIVDDAEVTTTITNAIYASEALDGINEAGESVKVALIDMISGL